MLKGHHNHKRRESVSVHCASKVAAATGLLIALTAGAAFAQALPAAQDTVNSGLQAEAAALLTLQKAIALALDGNLDLAIARREIEATQGQVIQGKLAPIPNWRTRWKTSGQRPAHKVCRSTCPSKWVASARPVSRRQSEDATLRSKN